MHLLGLWTWKALENVVTFPTKWQQPRQSQTHSVNLSFQKKKSFEGFFRTICTSPEILSEMWLQNCVGQYFWMSSSAEALSPHAASPVARPRYHWPSQPNYPPSSPPLPLRVLSSSDAATAQSGGIRARNHSDRSLRKRNANAGDFWRTMDAEVILRKKDLRGRMKQFECQGLVGDVLTGGSQVFCAQIKWNNSQT